MLARISSAVLVLAIGGCVAQGPTLNAQAEEMELALVACKAQLGFSGQLKTEVSFDGGVASAKALPFDQISTAQADQINACASGTETLNDGLVFVPLTDTAPVAVATPIAPTAAAPVQTPPETNGACPIGVTGMYAGTLYCTGNN